MDNGQAHAINKGWGMSNGEIIGWWNSDDYLAPDALDYLSNSYANNLSARVFIGKCASVDIIGNIIGIKNPYNFTYKTLLFKKSLGQPSVFLSK